MDIGRAIGAEYVAQVLAVLEITPKSNVEEISIDEMQHLTDELRRQAVMVLPSESFSVLTRDNIIALIPPDEKEAECLAEGCAVDIGRAIGAEYVAQGQIGKFGKKLSISVELYETMSGKLLSSIVMESEDIEGLLAVIRQEANPLFSKIKKTDIAPIPNPQSPISSQVSPQVSPQKSNIPMWAAIALDVIGAGLLVYGVVKNAEVDDLQKKYNAYGAGQQAEINATRKKMDDAASMRSIMYISGGVALTLGIGVHIWF